MMARYFFNISELIENGQSIDDVIFTIEYDEQISMQQEPVVYRGLLNGMMQEHTILNLTGAEEKFTETGSFRFPSELNRIRIT